MSIEAITASMRAIAPRIKSWSPAAESILMDRLLDQCAQPLPAARFEWQPSTGVLTRWMARAVIDAQAIEHAA